MKTYKKSKIFTKIDFEFLIIGIFFVLIFLVGGLSNLFVVNSNENKMPVKYFYSFQGEKHFSYIEKDEVKFWYLSDVFELSNFIFSIGDFFLFLGLIGYSTTTLFYMMHRIKLRWKR